MFANFCMAPCLIFHAGGDVFLLVALHTVFAELRAEMLEKLIVARQVPRFEHGRLGQHVAIGLRDSFAHRARRMSNFETDVPKKIENPLDGMLERLRHTFAEVRMKKHDIDVAPRIEFSASVAAQRHEAYGNDRGSILLLRGNNRRRKNMTQENVDERRAARAHLTPPAARLMAQSQAMIFDLEKLLVEREQMRRLSAGRGPQLTPSVRQNFFLMVGHLEESKFKIQISKSETDSKDQKLRKNEKAFPKGLIFPAFEKFDAYFGFRYSALSGRRFACPGSELGQA